MDKHVTYCLIQQANLTRELQTEHGDAFADASARDVVGIRAQLENPAQNNVRLFLHDDEELGQLLQNGPDDVGVAAVQAGQQRRQHFRPLLRVVFQQPYH